MKITRAEADEIYRAFIDTVGYLALVHKMDGYVRPSHPDEEPFHVPFAENADKAYEGWTPEIRTRLMNLIEDSVSPE